MYIYNTDTVIGRRKGVTLLKLPDSTRHFWVLHAVLLLFFMKLYSGTFLEKS